MISRDQLSIKTLAALPSLEKVLARMLVDAGIRDTGTLRRLGTIECFRPLRFRHGDRVTTNFIYALECAILGIDWRTLDKARKTQLKQRADAVKAELAAINRSARLSAR